jgi:hypothetical protein
VIHPESMFEDGRIEPNYLHAALETWFDSLGPVPVELLTTWERSLDFDDEGQFVYGARLAPRQLDMMQVDVWLTAQGHLAVGVEEVGRVRRRLGAPGADERSTFAWSGEPDPDNGSTVMPMLRCASAGLIALEVRRWPWGFGRIRATVSDSDLNRLSFGGVHTALLPRRRSSTRGILPPTVLEYSPWRDAKPTGAS